MKTRTIAGIISLLFVGWALSGCAPQYYYHFPKEEELRGIVSDSLHWRYQINTVVQIPVADDAGHLFWLDVDRKTKLAIKTILGEDYTFTLQSIHITGDDQGIFGPTAQWTAYDTRQHVNRTIAAREIGTMSVIAGSAAKTPITR